MSDILLDQYEDYLVDFQAWGHEFFENALTFDELEGLSLEQEEIDISEECGRLSKKQRERREQIQRLLLTHACYFADGPRVTVTVQKRG